MSEEHNNLDAEADRVLKELRKVGARIAKDAVLLIERLRSENERLKEENKP